MIVKCDCCGIVADDEEDLGECLSCGQHYCERACGCRCIVGESFAQAVAISYPKCACCGTTREDAEELAECLICGQHYCESTCGCRCIVGEVFCAVIAASYFELFRPVS